MRLGAAPPAAQRPARHRPSSADLVPKQPALIVNSIRAFVQGEALTTAKGMGSLYMLRGGRLLSGAQRKMRKSILLKVPWSGARVLAQTVAAPTRPSTIPDTDGVYAVTRLVNHAEAGLLPLTAAEGVDVPTWAESRAAREGPARPPVLLQWSCRRRAPTTGTAFRIPLQKSGHVSWRYAAPREWAMAVRAHGRQRLAQVQPAVGEIQDTRAGVCRASRSGARDDVNRVGRHRRPGDRVVRADEARVSTGGEPIAIVFTMRNPPDAPPVRGGVGAPWSFELTRDGHLVAGMGRRDARVMMPPAPLLPSGPLGRAAQPVQYGRRPGVRATSSSQARLLTGWRDVDPSVCPKPLRGAGLGRVDLYPVGRPLL